MDLFYLVGLFVVAYLFSNSLLLAFIIVIIAYVLARKLKYRDKNYFFKVFLAIQTPVWLLIPRRQEHRHAKSNQG